MRLGLIGFPGSGKSSLLNFANAESFRTIDTDAVVQKRVSIDDFIKEGRDSEFREIETSVILECLAADNDMIAFGGGVHTGHIAWKDIENADLKVLFLKQSFERCIERAPDRPLLKKLGFFRYRELFDKRQNMYADASDFFIDVDDKPLDIVWNEVKELWN